jgi:hypothetical protein
VRRTARLSSRSWIICAVLVLGGIIGHRPDLIVTPQFFGDESLWFGDAYMHGAWHSLVTPQAGYLCVGSKIANIPAVLLPVRFAPAVFSGFAIAVQALMCLYLLSSRLDSIAPLSARLLLCFYWVALPNCFEVLTLNNTQWILAVGGALVLLSSPPISAAWKIIDVAVIAVMGVTGPYCFLLLPIAFLLWFVRRRGWTAVFICILGITCIIQGYVLTHWHGECVPVQLVNRHGVQLLAIQIFSLGILAMNAAVQQVVMARFMVTGIFVGLGLAIVVLTLMRAPLELRLFVAFGVLVTTAAAFRLHCDPHWRWDGLLSHEASSDRYWYIPRLGFVASLVWLALDTKWSIRTRSVARAALLCLALVALVSWRYPAPPDFHWPQYARELQNAPPGTTVWIPVNPPGWKFYLTKK